MRPGIAIVLTDTDRRRLTALIVNRNAIQKHVWRAQIILQSADGFGTNDIMRSTGKSKTCVWRWQARFAQEGINGLLRDKTRPARIPPLPPTVTDRVIDLTRSEPPQSATHWSAAKMAAAIGISISSVQRIWRARGIQPHRVRRYAPHQTPQAMNRLHGIVGLYVDPSAHALAFTVEQTNTRHTPPPYQPRLPLTGKPPALLPTGKRRSRVGQLPDTLKSLEATPRSVDRRQRGLKGLQSFLHTQGSTVATEREVHIVVDVDVVGKHPGLQSWIDRNTNIVIHILPGTETWQFALEHIFAKLATRRLGREAYRSIAAVQSAIDTFAQQSSPAPQPFVWTIDSDIATPGRNRGYQVSDSRRHRVRPPPKESRNATTPASPTPLPTTGPLAAMTHIGLLTPIGYLTVFAEDERLVALEFGGAPPADTTPFLAEAARQLHAYFDGRLRAFDLACAPQGTTFQRNLWEALRHIPYGSTVTYGDLARMVGGAARAIGGACGANPIPIVIPCHRVIGAGGQMVGYSGGEGAATKQALLRLEGAMLL